MKVYQWDEVSLELIEHEVPELPLQGKELMGAIDGLLAARIDMDAGSEREYSEHHYNEATPERPALKLACRWGQDKEYRLYACPGDDESAKAIAEDELDAFSGPQDGDDW